MANRRWLLPVAALGAALLYGAWRRGPLRRLAEDLHSLAAMESVSAQGARLFDTFSAAEELIFIGIARETVDRLPGGSVLDVGCGPGRLAVRIAKSAPRVAVTGLDIAPKMIERARRRAASAGLADRVRFEVGDVVAMPFRDGQFDLVVSSFSMHHWADVAGGLAEVHRVLKPGGRACIYDLTGGLLRLFRHGDRVSAEDAARWFGGEVEDRVWSPGPVQVLRRLCLTSGVRERHTV